VKRRQPAVFASDPVGHDVEVPRANEPDVVNQRGRLLAGVGRPGQFGDPAALRIALDVVVNNAAVNPKGASLGSYRRDEVAAVFGANTIGPLLMGQAMLPLLLRGERPRLVNISTQVGSFTWNTGGKSPLYAASKAALNMFTRSMAREAVGVVVIAVHPGWVQTDMGGASAPLSPSTSVKDLRALIDRLQPSDTGQFFNHDGQHHPW